MADERNKRKNDVSLKWAKKDASRHHTKSQPHWGQSAYLWKSLNVLALNQQLSFLQEITYFVQKFWTEPVLNWSQNDLNVGVTS